MKILSTLLILLGAKAAFAKVIDYPVQLGNTLITIKKISYGSGKNFIHVHENETTALSAAIQYIKKHGGSVITIQHGGERNVSFNLNKKHYEFDPNRIYTNQGIRKTLQKYGDYSPAAHQQVEKLASTILRLLPEGKIIAVHNNQDYSLHNYFPGHSLQKDAEELNVCKDCFYRNFFLVTNNTEHKRLTAAKFNSILQAHGAEDDGSLSISLSHRNYVNVEAGYDQLQAQLIMLKNA